jgi:hypothetical protein
MLFACHSVFEAFPSPAAAAWRFFGRSPSEAERIRRGDLRLLLTNRSLLAALAPALPTAILIGRKKPEDLSVVTALLRPPAGASADGLGAVAEMYSRIQNTTHAIAWEHSASPNGAMMLLTRGLFLYFERGRE